MSAAAMEPHDPPVLDVDRLRIEVRTPRGVAAAVEDASFSLRRGEALGLVGESGSGKSIMMLALMGLLSDDSARVVAGRLRFLGEDLYGPGFASYRRELRGGAMAMIFQEPMTSLNPVLSIGRQIGDAIRAHAGGLAAGEAERRAAALLRLVGVPEPERRLRQFPHEYSGGMRQRVMIAMAIANDPRVLIADEPTTALDVTVQAQIMEALAQARAASGASLILVTHDLGLIAETVDRIAVMYGGQIVETGGAAELFEQPRHPYTIGLMRSLPGVDRGRRRLYAIPGQPPAVNERPGGCVFHPRCEMRRGEAICAQERPALRAVTATQAAACHFADATPDWSRNLARSLAEDGR